MNLKEFVQQNTLRSVNGGKVQGLIEDAAEKLSDNATAHLFWASSSLRAVWSWTRRRHHRNSAEPVTP